MRTRAVLLCAVLALAGVAPASTFGLPPALRCAQQGARGRLVGRTCSAAVVPFPLRRGSCRLRASEEGAPGTWTPKSGKKPLVVLVGFMGATPAIMVSERTQ